MSVAVGQVVFFKSLKYGIVTTLSQKNGVVYFPA